MKLSKRKTIIGIIVGLIAGIIFGPILGLYADTGHHMIRWFIGPFMGGFLLVQILLDK